MEDYVQFDVNLYTSYFEDGVFKRVDKKISFHECSDEDKFFEPTERESPYV